MQHVAVCAEPTSAWMLKSSEVAVPWLLGKEITLADVAVMPSLIRINDLGMPDWQDLPRVVTWFDNIRAHPAFKPTFYHGSLVSERFPHLREKEHQLDCAPDHGPERVTVLRLFAQYFAEIGSSSAGNQRDQAAAFVRDHDLFLDARSGETVGGGVHRKIDELTKKKDEIELREIKHKQELKSMREEMENRFQQILAKIDVGRLS